MARRRVRPARVRFQETPRHRVAIRQARLVALIELAVLRLGSVRAVARHLGWTQQHVQDAWAGRVELLWRELVELASLLATTSR